MFGPVISKKRELRFASVQIVGNECVARRAAPSPDAGRRRSRSCSRRRTPGARSRARPPPARANSCTSISASASAVASISSMRPASALDAPFRTAPLRAAAAASARRDRDLQFLEFGRHEALGVGQRLFANVIAGHASRGSLLLTSIA